MRSKTPLPGSREGGGGWVPICQHKIMRISAKPLSRRKITSEHPQEDEISIAIPRTSGAKTEGVKPPTRGGFTPSKQPAGRSLFEAQGIFRPLRRAA